jgi:hypothetical protein
MEVAMIETLLYRHNQEIKPDLCITALINTSLKYLQNPPSIKNSNRLGLLTGSAIVAVPSLESNSITETNIIPSNIMLSVLKSIVPNSLKYKTVEILCCSPFQQSNMFAGKTDTPDILKLTLLTPALSKHAVTIVIEPLTIPDMLKLTLMTPPISSHAETDFIDHSSFQQC